jgi:hypothetical protein
MSEASHTLDDEQVPATPQLCMQTVQDYRRDKLSKVMAVRDILSAFRKSEAYANTSQDDLDSAIGMYVAMLDPHDASRQTSVIRGSRTRDATDGEDEEDLVGTVGDKRPRPSDVHGLTSGQRPSQARPHRPSQAKPKVLAWSWLWPGLDFLKAKANGPGHGFEHYFFR